MVRPTCQLEVHSQSQNLYKWPYLWLHDCLSAGWFKPAVLKYRRQMKCLDAVLKWRVLICYFIKTLTFLNELINVKENLFSSVNFHHVALGRAVGWGTALQTGWSRVRFPPASLEFFIDIIFPTALWPWGRGEFRPRQTRQLPRAVDLKGRLLSSQSY